MADEQVNLWALLGALVAVAFLLAFLAGWLFLVTRSGWVIAGFSVAEFAVIGIGRYWVRETIIRRALEL
jgi:hypothetical protein